LTPLLGSYMAKIFQGQKTILTPLLSWLERASYSIAGINPNIEMSWKSYTKALIAFNAFGAAFLFFLLISQDIWPFNPQQLPSLSIPLAFNIAISFVTNTNWQSYAGETTLSYTSQMVGLTTQNFLSAATGIAVFLALARGLTRQSIRTIGNFWVDMVRAVVYLLLPLSLIFSIVLVSQGVIQNFLPYKEVTTLEGNKQIIPGGPAASQVAIKQLGTNGGGFFNANSAHPFENPTRFTNFLETLALLLIPAALTYTYGSMIQSRRHGVLIFAVMLAFWGATLALSLYSASIPDPVLGNTLSYEGKETRFGLSRSVLWAVSTTTSANGAVNAALSSFSPLTGGLALFNMLLGELIFGGAGVGLCHMILFIILTVFMAGLMVGRTPQYLGNRIEKLEMQWVIIAVLVPGILTLLGATVSSVLPIALDSISEHGPHGLTEIVYAFASAANNNGSAFAGLSANNDYFNISLGIVMLLTRLSTIVPSLALAGLFANKKTAPSSVGTFSTNTVLFTFLLSSIILIVGALTFFPVLSLGPIVEHILMIRGISF
jgi:K+-transporting ATPase ATPase A chain